MRGPPKLYKPWVSSFSAQDQECKASLSKSSNEVAPTVFSVVQIVDTRLGLIVRGAILMLSRHAAILPNMDGQQQVQYAGGSNSARAQPRESSQTRSIILQLFGQ